MIITDGIHLMSDTSLQELHTFAHDKLGFRMEWFQDHPIHPHYDLTTRRARNIAIQNGAVLVEPAELVRIYRNAPYIALMREERDRA